MNYPEIRRLTLSQVEAALRLAMANFESLKPESRLDVLQRIWALEDRRRVLYTRQRRATRKGGR